MHLSRHDPVFEDYLATGALANVPFWIYILLLTFDTNRYSQSNALVFYTIIPLAVMGAGGFVASHLLCKRSKGRFLRIGLLVGVSATLVNFVFGLATSIPSTLITSFFLFMTGSVVAALLTRSGYKGEATH
jgi:peptidoglycan/LPS O-acetylase OafA/YrhL